MSRDMPQGQPTEEEMRAALEEELRRVRVEQVVVESAVSILNVAVMRAGLVPGSEGDRDLDQVRVGIEGVRSLLPLVEQIAGADQARPIRDALSQLQMAYVQAAGSAPGGGEAPAAGDPSAPAGGEQATPGTSAGSAPQPPQGGQPGQGGGAGPAQSSGRLWVPGQ